MRKRVTSISGNNEKKKKGEGKAFASSRRKTVFDSIPLYVQEK